VWSALQAYDDLWIRGVLPEPALLESPPPEPHRQMSMALKQDLKEPPKNAGQIERLCYKISQAYSHLIPEGYEQYLRAFKDLAKVSGIAHPKSLPANVLLSGEGLYLVNQVRHALAQWDHLDIDLEEHPGLEDDPAHHPHVMTIEAATRLALLTMQIMTLCIFPPATRLLTHHFRGFEELEEVRIEEAMVNLHLEDFAARVEESVNQHS
jgi:hypothetical protein